MEQILPSKFARRDYLLAFLIEFLQERSCMMPVRQCRTSNHDSRMTRAAASNSRFKCCGGGVTEIPKCAAVRVLLGAGCLLALVTLMIRVFL